MSPSDESLVTRVAKVAKAGSAVVFNCTLDAYCFNRSIDSVEWRYQSAFDTRQVTWYRSRKLNPMLMSSGVTVEEDPVRGWNVLNIPRVRLADRGIFHCDVPRLLHCHMSFQLVVNGNICNI